MGASSTPLTSTLGAGTRDVQQLVRVSGLDAVELVSCGMINDWCFCSSVVITGLTCNQFHAALMLFFILEF